MQTGSQALAQVITLFNLPQQQTATIRGNPATLEIGDNFLGRRGLQNEVVYDTLFPKGILADILFVLGYQYVSGALSFLEHYR